MTEEEVRGLLAVMGFELVVEPRVFANETNYYATAKRNGVFVYRKRRTREMACTDLFNAVTKWWHPHEDYF